MNSKIININDIVSVYVTFVGSHGGKKRPMLVVEVRDKMMLALSLSSQYNQKSNEIKQQSYPLVNWKEAGLKKQSYVDINALKLFRISNFDLLNRIGWLTTRDQQGLAHFINKYNRTIDKTLFSSVIFY